MAFPPVITVTDDAANADAQHAENSANDASAPHSPALTAGSHPAPTPETAGANHLGASLAPVLRVPSQNSSTQSTNGPRTPSAESEGSTFVDVGEPTSPAPSEYESKNATQLLRGNEPDKTQGKSSLSLLNTNGGRTKSNHSRSVSIDESTDHGHGPVTPASEVPPVISGDASAEGNRPKPTALEADDTIDPAPFAFMPSHLAQSLDPKSVEQIDTWGGTRRLLEGLGTDEVSGLITTPVDGKAPASPSSDTAADEKTLASGRSDSNSETTHGTVRSGAPTATQLYEARHASLDLRRKIYGANDLPVRKSKSLLLLMWIALQDRVLIVLSIAAVVSLALGLYQDFGAEKSPIACSDGRLECYPPKVDWVEGVAILVAVAIVVLVGSVNDWQKERQFKVLNAKKEDRGVKVIRNGSELIINVRDVVVGDIALLEPGEIVPVDGIFLSGHNVRCDESGATGESDAVRKAPFEECWREHLEVKEKRANGETDVSDPKKDPFLISGSKVMEGVGKYVVVAVGQKSFNGRIMMGLRGDTPATPLQTKLNRLAGLIATLGSAAGLLLFVALMIRFFVQLHSDPDRTPDEKAQSFVQILIISVTVVVVAVPEGLPLAVTLALAFATKRMTKANLLVRVLGSCETMANATVVCTDKTGTLTQNVMSVVAGAIGVHGKFVNDLDANKARSNVGKVEGDEGEKEADVKERDRKHKDDFALDMKDVNSCLSPQLRKLFNDSIAINSTAFEDKDPDSGDVVFVGSKTETALLRFAKGLDWADYKKTRETAQVVQMIPFSSERKAMGVVVKLSSNRWRVFFKGASEILTRQCTKHVVVRPDAERTSADSKHSELDDVEVATIGTLEEENISRTIIFYANQMLRTIALCYRDFESWPPVQNTDEQGEVPFSYLAQELTLVAITGIEDPLRPGVTEAVAKCQGAGVAVKMCTGDNVLTARSIASQCGIYSPGGVIMEGPAFRKLSETELYKIVPRLQVLARSSPEDKKILVAALKHLGEVVGVTGDGSNDSLALKEAHVGFSMGIAGTEVAKEASDIILMDDNFASIVSAIMWGRTVNDAVKKFLQFQISVNVTAVVITFVTAVASNSETSVLTAVQLLWINIIMDTFAALALATDPAHPILLERKPDRLTAPLFNVDMTKMIIGQSIYQILIILIFHFLGPRIFGYHNSTTLNEFEINKLNTELGTLIFNAFVFCQIFNSVNSRRLDNKLNIFEGVLANRYFMGITAIEVGAQILIVFVGGSAFQVTRMNGRDWGISIALGFASWPIAVLIRLIPNGPVERFFIKFKILPDPNALPKVNPASEQKWNEAVDKVQDTLATFKSIRGGRLRAASFIGKSQHSRMEKAGIELPSILAIVPAMVAGSVGGGWKPQGGDLSDPAHHDPSQSSTALFEGKVQVHPETDRGDPIFNELPKDKLEVV